MSKGQSSKHTLLITLNDCLSTFEKSFFWVDLNVPKLWKMNHYFGDMFLSMQKCVLSTKSSRLEASCRKIFQRIFLRWTDIIRKRLAKKNGPKKSFFVSHNSGTKVQKYICLRRHLFLHIEEQNTSISSSLYDYMETWFITGCPLLGIRR